MSGYLGMNPEDMKQLVALLNSKAKRIEEIQAHLSSLVRSTTWDGPDAERFKSDWDSDHAKKLQRVAHALEEIARSAHRELTQQTQTSH
ncbi:WXG100 family type VII secretion target [Xylanimonas protaetiae]|uniref:WXG100 family type VII secretion target n=1 Tax=Xylanimonas protaetiae TaxID=2509457 RepID=A0A4P6F3R7_9MICO|nr:WXG100 family type VII secretion target [Xylanimonas protaetiae]QAY69956.1 hypothetical protein ET471_07865 [Xylanimonas protaetiae]